MDGIIMIKPYSLNIDWLSFTSSSDNSDLRGYLVERLHFITGETFVEKGGLYGYTQTLRSSVAIIAWGGSSQNNTMFVSLTGSACAAFGWFGISALLRKLILQYGVTIRFSRVDLALDVLGNVYHHFQHPFQVYNRLDDKRIRKVMYIRDYELIGDPTDEISTEYSETGFTCYIGSRTSERFMRIYKKRLHDGVRVTRFEYELKERYALVAGEFLLQGSSISECFIVVSSNHLRISDLIDLSFDMVNEPSCLSLPRKKQSDRAKWLSRVSPAIVQFMIDNPDRWVRILEEGYEVLGYPPSSNTGVHFSVPSSLLESEVIYLNEVTFGTSFHPLDRQIMPNDFAFSFFS